MVRKLRYRQVIAYTVKESRKKAYKEYLEANREANTEPVSGVELKYLIASYIYDYRDKVLTYQRLVKPETGTPTIPQARVMHTTLGTWDSKTHWDSWDCVSFKYMDNMLFIRREEEIKIVHPKGNYKRIKGLTQ
ncbi:hypothetical protein [Bacillus wiedmannii]|uniref:hypothetical protein n=1 Tax=Bacillus wiedmannii TaxID=1890302 RepID=UPI000BF1CAA6|nr:hypothetical protein [Bacillus wiedmannii]PEO36743.1 hypothetical protein CN555_21310 [Bacillus wiedmannii]